MWPIQQKNPTLKSLVVFLIILHLAIHVSGALKCFGSSSTLGDSSATKALKAKKATENSVHFHLELADTIKSRVPVPSDGSCENLSTELRQSAHEYADTVQDFMKKCGHFQYVPDRRSSTKNMMECIKSGWTEDWDQILNAYTAFYNFAYQDEQSKQWLDNLIR